MKSSPNLCYTIALDQPGQQIHRQMARLLVTSLLRTGWKGSIVVFRNTQIPVLREGHPQVAEIIIDASVKLSWDDTMRRKYRVRNLLDLKGVNKVLFLDCDCIALREINSLMFGSWDIYTAPEPGRLVEWAFNGYLTEAEMAALKDKPGLNAGVMGIRAARYLEVMEEWERIEAGAPIRPSKTRDQHAWNRLILDTTLRRRLFVPGAVQFPFLHRAVYTDYRRAAIVHAADKSPEEKLPLLYGLWAEAFGRDRFEDFVTP